MRKVEVHKAASGWANQVSFANGPTPFAFVPREIVVAGARGRDLAAELFNRRFAGFEPVFDGRDDGPGQYFVTRIAADDDVRRAIDDLRLEGVAAQPNHVLFAHGDCCCGPHPADRWQSCVAGSPVHGSPVYGSPVHGSPVYGSSVSASPVYGSPVYGSPVYGSPVYGSPVYGSPVYGSPVYGSPVYGSPASQSGHRRSSAAPADAPITPVRHAPAGALVPRIAILDTGLARKGLRPNALDFVQHASTGWAEGPDDDGDDFLDPAAGHGTFIAGLIDLLTPGCDLTAERVLSNYGAGDEVAIAQRIDAIDADLLNLSFGGYALDHMDVLAAAINGAQQKGTVVVASAGNDGICRPSLPAAFPDVVSVAALGPYGPARFSNYGPWVRACAPGVDIVSRFFTKFDGKEVAPAGGIDPDKFASWARWSGTSFSGPIVVAALARELQLGLTTAEAVERVIDAPGLLRIPDFGTVVNVQ